VGGGGGGGGGGVGWGGGGGAARPPPPPPPPPPSGLEGFSYWNWNRIRFRTRVNRPITDRLPMTEHFGRSFSILLHFE